jgi:hypothetical protein
VTTLPHRVMMLAKWSWLESMARPWDARPGHGYRLRDRRLAGENLMRSGVTDQLRPAIAAAILVEDQRVLLIRRRVREGELLAVPGWRRRVGRVKRAGCRTGDARRGRP